MEKASKQDDEAPKTSGFGRACFWAAMGGFTVALIAFLSTVGSTLSEILDALLAAWLFFLPSLAIWYIGFRHDLPKQGSSPRRKGRSALILLAFVVGFCVGFWQGRIHRADETYRVDIPIEWMVQYPDETRRLFMLHAERCRLLATYKPPVPEHLMGTAVSEIQESAQDILDAENALRQGEAKPR